MSNAIVTESGMTFSFPTDDLFRIEKCETYQSIKQQNVKIVDFVAKAPDRNNTEALFFIEAKSSAPSPNNPKSKERFDEYVNEIYEKFRNSVILYSGLLLNRPYTKKSTLPTNHSHAFASSAATHLVLIIKNHRDEWCEALQNTFSQHKGLTAIKKTFYIKNILVVNEEIAKEYGLITQAQSNTNV